MPALFPAGSEPETVNSSHPTHFLRLGCHLPAGCGDHGVPGSDPIFGWATRELAIFGAISRPFSFCSQFILGIGMDEFLYSLVGKMVLYFGHRHSVSRRR